jgi:aminopeptidase N
MGTNVARLFEQFQPEHYNLRLDLDRDNMTFSGTVTVTGKKTGRPSQRLTFHQKGLKVSSAVVTKHDKNGDQAVTIGRINNQNTLDEVRLHSDDMIYPGSYTITMEFSGDITRPMNGIYPCFFKHEGKDKLLIASQFESHHAREAFPCIDEPEAKATFDLTLGSPAGETALANTPVKQQVTQGDLLITEFETTPRMSVYLLAFVAGEIGYKEVKTQDGVVIRAYATPDNVKLTQFGLDAAVGALEFFGDYFSTPYPLKKLDMVALPDFSVGAMENWGLMTFRETCMLADPQTSSIESKQLVALVVSHEISHQWFGDLVTMKWWNDLWLNESFANMMEYRVVDHLFPEWHIWEQFVSHEAAAAKRRDSLADIQPIKTDVNHPDEIATLFDPSIVYAKGGTVLHMLMRYIGEDAFQAGLKTYFEKHRYGNTVADDLWAELSASSNQDIGAFMHSWIERPGFPLVSIDWKPGDKQFAADQHRFLSSSKTDVSTNSEPWPVPLATTYELSKPLFDSQQATVAIASASDQPLLFNHDGQSYFVPRYVNKEHLKQIVDGIQANKVDVIDRLLLLDNYNLLQRSGDASTVELLELLQAYTNEDSESVWGAMAMAVAEGRRLMEGDAASEKKLHELIRRLAGDNASRLGWEDQPDDSAQILRLRGLVVSIAAGAKDQRIIDEGLERFAASKEPADLPPSTRGVIYYIAARYGTPADFQKLLDTYHATNSADEREEIASALTSTKEPAHYKQLIDMFTGEDIRRQDLMHWYVWLLRNRYSRPATWEWLTSHWDWIEKEFEGDKNHGSFARYAGSIFSREADLKQFRDFFGPMQDIVALSRDIKLAEQEILNRIAWRNRNEDSVRSWLLGQ